MDAHEGEDEGEDDVRLRLGIDVACKAAHQVSCTDATGRFLFCGRRFRTTVEELERLWASLPAADEVLVVLEPTRNAWVPLAAWLRARGAKVALVPPEQSADLRDYYHKHTKNDRLDSRVLARLPLLHPEGLRVLGEDELGPADPLRRATRRRRSLVKRRTAAYARIDALLELLGPHWADAVGSGEYAKTALTVLQRTGADPHAIKRLGRKRLTALLVRASRGQWRDQHAEAILHAAEQSLQLWAAGGPGLRRTRLRPERRSPPRPAADRGDRRPRRPHQRALRRRRPGRAAHHRPRPRHHIRRNDPGRTR